MLRDRGPVLLTWEPKARGHRWGLGLRDGVPKRLDYQLTTLALTGVLRADGRADKAVAVEHGSRR
jgi:hypothetical protein